MGVKRARTYTLEFKEQALQLAKEMKSAAKAAGKLGIPVSTIHGWRNRKKFGVLNGASDGDIPSHESIEEENKRLRKEVEELKKVNHILKRAAAFFSQDHLK
jgi:transposase-like protein